MRSPIPGLPCSTCKSRAWVGTQRIKCMGTGEHKRRGAGSGADFLKRKMQGKLIIKDEVPEHNNTIKMRR